MSTLGSWLKVTGFNVDDNPVLGRSTTWKKVGWLMVHHTAGSDAASAEVGQMNYLKTAQGKYPPLAQIGLGQSGKVYMISRQRAGQAEPGRASHAGAGVYPGIPRDTANQVTLGIECHCSGAHPLSNHQKMYSELIKLLVALCKRYSLTEKNVIGHKEYSSTGKIDPRDNMDVIRALVKKGLVVPPPSVPVGDDDMPTIIKCESTGRLAVYNGVSKWVIGSNTPNYVARAFPGIKTVNEPQWFFDGIPDAHSTEQNSYLAAVRTNWLANTWAGDVPRRVWAYKNVEIEARDTYQILRDAEAKAGSGGDGPVADHTHTPGGVTDA